MPIGASYAPGADIPMEGRNGNGGGASRLSPQQAVKILSLRVPEALPSNAPVSRSLLTSPGGSAAGASGLQSMIQQLMQSFKPQAGTMPTAGPMPGGPPQAMQGQQPSPATSPVGVPPQQGQQPAPLPGAPNAPSSFQSFPNAPALSPSPMFAPHITWGDEWQKLGPAAPFALGSNQDEIDHWNQMFNPGGINPWQVPGL